MIFWSLIYWTFIFWTNIIWTKIFWTVIIWNMIFWTNIFWTMILWTVIIWTMINWTVPLWRFMSSLVGVRKGTYLSMSPPLEGMSKHCIKKEHKNTYESLAYRQHILDPPLGQLFGCHSHWKTHQTQREDHLGPPELEFWDQARHHLGLGAPWCEPWPCWQDLTCSCRLAVVQLQ